MRFCCRGYVYDQETGLYYVSSRYYDPQIGRLISPDTTDILTATPMGLTDKNLYAYCDNNPVVRADHGGDFWHIVVGAAVGAVTNLATNGICNLLTGRAFFDGWSYAMATGAISGAATAICPAFGAMVDAGISAAESVYEDVSNGENLATIITNATISVGFSVVTSGGGSTFSDKKIVSNSLKAIGNTLPGNHPSIKNAAKKTLRKTYKKIRGEFLEDFSLGVISNSLETGVKTYVGIFTSSVKTQTKLRGYTY